MKIKVIAIDKTDADWVREAIELYKTRIVRYIPFDYLELESGGNRRDRGGSNGRAGEDKILKMLRNKDTLILLDEAGLQYNSRGFAGWLGQQFAHGSSSDLVFVIGGPYGFSDAIKQKASLLLSLSKMTFTHQMVRPFMLEQIYRALTILRNESYHHD